MKNFFAKQNKGFTIVETLVALSIFSMSILTIISVLADGISDTGYAKKKLTASYLAQEGIEYMRNMRDAFVLYDPAGPQVGWAAFLAKLSPCDATTDTTKTCYFGDLTAANFTDQTRPMIDLPLTACTPNCPPLRYEAATGKYNYAPASTVTDFNRRIKTINFNSSKVEVISTVSWTQGSGVYSMSFSEVVFQWVE